MSFTFRNTRQMAEDYEARKVAYREAALAREPFPWFVYAIAEAGDAYVKIGIAKSPRKRRMELQMGNPRKLRIIRTWGASSEGDAYQAEQSALDRLPKSRASGEWLRTGGNLDYFLELIEPAIADALGRTRTQLQIEREVAA